MKGLFKVVGCMAGSPSNGIPASGYLIKGADGNILIDCGPGVVSALNRDEIENLSSVIISHQHSDHCLDLVALSYSFLFPNRRKKIPLYGPPALFETLKSIDNVFGIPTLSELQAPISMAFDFVSVKPGESFSAGAFVFDTLKMKHPVETIAIRSRDFNLVYTADGAYSNDLEIFCKGCEYLVAEATYPEQGNSDLEKHGHMTAEICGTLASSAGAKQLIITHLSDLKNSTLTIETAEQYFRGKIRLAYPGLELLFF